MGSMGKFYTPSTRTSGAVLAGAGGPSGSGEEAFAPVLIGRGGGAVPGGGVDLEADGVSGGDLVPGIGGDDPPLAQMIGAEHPLAVEDGCPGHVGGEEVGDELVTAPAGDGLGYATLELDHVLHAFGEAQVAVPGEPEDIA